MSKGTILVADDSALIRQVIADALGPLGYLVLHAADGAEALSVIGRGGPDLVIADVLMPVMDGWALCEAVRRGPVTATLPFIFLTTERDVPKRIMGLEMGADDYVCKPFSKEELAARVEAVLRRARAAGQAREPARAVPPPVLAGHTSHAPLSDLVQMLSLNNRSGTLHVSGASVARIYFREGRILNAETQGLRGEKALFRIVAWPEARFEFEDGEPARDVEVAFTEGTSSVLMEGFAHLDELRDLIARLPERGRRLRAARAEEDPPAGPPLTTAHRLILYTAGERGATLGEIVDRVPDKDLDAYTAVDDLLRRGMLEICDAGAQC